jgi:hypothetical protein|tara:strand:+ start:154 stop:336 length:183 start_codon:yes stop_codon:yes gene_type:complete
MGIKKIKTRTKKKEVSALTKDGYGKNKVNHLGYPLDDPYGLSEAFTRVFGFNNVTDKKRN